MARYEQYESRGWIDDSGKEVEVTFHHREWWNHEIDVCKDPSSGEWVGDGIAYGEWFDIDGNDDVLMWYGEFMTVKEIMDKFDTFNKKVLKERDGYRLWVVEEADE